MLIKLLDGSSREVADLSGADLRSANLSGADLRGADLSGAYLSDANLSRANLRSANLRDADLRSANLRGADLRDADLRSANLRSAHLSRANLTDTKGLEQFCILPAGEIRGYKKLADGTIAVLTVPAEAKRVNAYGSRKCRAEFAYVIEGAGKAKHNGMPYQPGRIVPDSYDPDPRVECSHGIHFFITRQEAVDY